MLGQSVPVFVLTAFFALQVVGVLARLALGTPFLTYHPPYWRTLLIYGVGAAYVGYLCWRRSPRARFAVYVFLTVDIIRAIRGAHWWMVLADLALLLVMQMPAFRADYPPIQPVSFRRRRCPRQAPPMPGRADPSNGGDPPANGRSHVVRP